MQSKLVLFGLGMLLLVCLLQVDAVKQGSEKKKAKTPANGAKAPSPKDAKKAHADPHAHAAPAGHAAPGAHPPVGHAAPGAHPPVGHAAPGAHPPVGHAAPGAHPPKPAAQKGAAAAKTPAKAPHNVPAAGAANKLAKAASTKAGKAEQKTGHSSPVHGAAVPVVAGAAAVGAAVAAHKVASPHVAAVAPAVHPAVPVPVQAPVPAQAFNEPLEPAMYAEHHPKFLGDKPLAPSPYDYPENYEQFDDLDDEYEDHISQLPVYNRFDALSNDDVMPGDAAELNRAAQFAGEDDDHMMEKKVVDPYDM